MTNQTEWDGFITCPECGHTFKAFYFSSGFHYPDKMDECRECKALIGFNCETGEIIK